MSNFKERSQVFLLGLMLGLLIGGGFFILKLDDYFKELNFYKSIAKTFTAEPKPIDIPITAESNKDTEEKKNSTGSKKSPAHAVDSSHSEQVMQLDVVSLDTLKNPTIKDSIYANNPAGDDIVVKKDELLFTKTLEVYNLDPTANKLSAKDSLLQKVSGIKDDRATGKQMFNIEFWQSPLNYKGYKLGKYKLVVYGISSNDALKLYKLDDIIYLKNGGFVYRLDYTADFKQYERITDEAIINKLK